MERVRNDNGRIACMWSEEDLRVIRENYEDGYDRLAERFGVTYQTMRLKCHEMGLTRSDPHRSQKRVFTSEEDEYIRVHYPHECASDIADHLGISYANLVKRVRHLGIRKSERFRVGDYNRRYVGNYSGNKKV